MERALASDGTSALAGCAAGAATGEWSRRPKGSLPTSG